MPLIDTNGLLLIVDVIYVSVEEFGFSLASDVHTERDRNAATAKQQRENNCIAANAPKSTLFLFGHKIIISTKVATNQSLVKSRACPE